MSRADFETALATYHRGNYPAAIELFTTLAHDGHGDAQHNLGQMYRLGQGVTPDDRVAASWYHRAAEQGVVPSQFNLGVMYELGRGVEQSLEERNLWFRHAARAGHMEARYALGLAYTDGEGTPPSESDALYWFHRATQSGHDKAPARVDQLYRHRHKLPLSDLIGDETARQKIVIHPVDASDNHLAFTLDKPAATTSYHYIAATNIWKAHWGIYLSPDYDAGFRYIESQRGFHFPIRIEGNLHTLGKLWPLLEGGRFRRLGVGTTASAFGPLRYERFRRKLYPESCLYFYHWFHQESDEQLGVEAPDRQVIGYVCKTDGGKLEIGESEHLLSGLRVKTDAELRANREPASAMESVLTTTDR